MKINEKEFKNILALDSKKRYEYFIKKIADNEVIYSLYDSNNNIATSDIDEYSLIPLWSDSMFAENCKVSGWEKYKSTELTLEYFNDNLVEMIENSGALLNIFPVGDQTGFIVNIEEFIRDLNEELENY